VCKFSGSARRAVLFGRLRRPPRICRLEGYLVGTWIVSVVAASFVLATVTPVGSFSDMIDLGIRYILPDQCIVAVVLADQNDSE